MRLGAVCCLGVLMGLACGGDDGGGGGGAAGGVSLNESDGGQRFSCVDEDGDGFGRNCRSGPDCDDDDPEITDECIRCTMDPTGCACEPGTPPMTCVPEDKRVEMNGMTGWLKCSEGARYCRESVWSECEFLAQYTVFVPD